MSEPAAASLPDAREQLASLAFALVLLDPHGQVADANPAAESMLGRSVKRMAGQPFEAFVSFADPSILSRLKASGASLVARGIAATVGSREMVVNASIAPVARHDGWHVLTLSDAGQGESLASGLNASRMRGQAILAHEIKTPLSAIRGAAQLLARKVPEEARHLSDLVADEVDRIVQLTDRMQRLGREQAEPVAPLNLHAAIRRASETVRAGSPAPIEICEEFDPSLPPVLANEGALVQVLINLLTNARDAMEEVAAPTLTVRTRFSSGLLLNVKRAGRPLKLPIEVQVTDNGPGIDSAIRDEIFEPFVTSKAKGQGLGLALVQKLVRDMNGRITHSRDEASGLTHFRIHLPMASDQE
ncbi:two-component system sensor histidine kinase NtrB [Paraurantiacibacter namhicola]|uniref:histidine kinase n=1 Tax=Paraurantiacibacter namhicola TaxID=645517 RepID=A0A1C7D945_9SPHN|nr:ATP-binding protein [Paraurantiacibacter namhicola]ANU07955.1 Nitrogen regulation protein NR(II) [Paraurantiacibacter namhicola]